MSWIIGIETTTISLVCPIDGDEYTRLVAGLQAGADGRARNMVDVTGCINGHLARVARVYNNSLEIGLAANGLHRHLVGLGQIDPAFAIQLAAELEIDKPQNYYTLTASTRKIWNDGPNMSWDLTAALAIHAHTDLRAIVQSGGMLTTGNDAAIGVFVAALYATAFDQAKYSKILKDKRIAVTGS